MRGVTLEEEDDNINEEQQQEQKQQQHIKVEKMAGNGNKINVMQEKLENKIQSKKNTGRGGKERRGNLSRNYEYHRRRSKLKHEHKRESKNLLKFIF